MATSTLNNPHLYQISHILGQRKWSEQCEVTISLWDDAYGIVSSARWIYLSASRAIQAEAFGQHHMVNYYFQFDSKHFMTGIRDSNNMDLVSQWGDFVKVRENIGMRNLTLSMGTS